MRYSINGGIFYDSVCDFVVSDDLVIKIIERFGFSCVSFLQSCTGFVWLILFRIDLLGW